MTKVWRIKEKTTGDLIEQLLINRGIKSEKEKQEFFNPKLNYYSKDLEIPNIEKGLKRIRQAIQKQELIIVYGDYDVDGVCASAILYKGLTSLGAKVLPYIPHREKEGYGLSKLGLEFARDSGAQLVITVDNGIVALEQAKFAKELGLDLIITDHHLPLDQKPDVFTIVHSTKMCGAAVAWCLIKDEISKPLSRELLQFVAIATVADHIPLLGLGRAFVNEGLKEINKSNNLGLRALASECAIDLPAVTSYEIGHQIAPRLNAVGRLEHAIDALRMLCTKDLIKARKLAQMLCEINITRQELTLKAVEEAKIWIHNNPNKKINILHSKDWKEGIIGLVAARVCEDSSRPSIAISVGENGTAKGSARSLPGVNIVEIIRQSSDLLIDIGGHEGAAGFSIATEKIEEFILKIESIADSLPDELSQYLEVEAEVPINKLTKLQVKEIDKFEPFGVNNPKPLLATFNMKISDIKTVGEGDRHLKFKADGIDAIAFGFGYLKDLLLKDKLVALAYNLEINKFRGQENLQLKVKDIQIN